jgi:serine/threonine protein kinase
MPFSPPPAQGSVATKSRSTLGAGGTGEVYLAHDSRLRRNVALKTLSAELAANTDRMRRFEQEATAAAALNHPNLARSPTTSWSRAMGTRRF